MEFLQTLAEKLPTGPMPLSDVYRVGIAVAEALAVAHRQVTCKRSEAGEHHADADGR